MLRVGLTGGISCGKSKVAEILRQRGAHVLSADRLAHQVYEPGAAVYEEVVLRFGRGILDDEGRVNRKKLADVVFPDRIAELNAIVHPAVIEAQTNWMHEVDRTDPRGIAVVEAALLLEAGAEKGFDKVIVVTCGFEQKVERFAQRAGVTADQARTEVERRAAAQFSDAEKARRADFVIDNSGSLEDLSRKVEEIWNKLQHSLQRDSPG